MIMQEPLVTISLREYQALKDLSDQFDSIRQNAKYTKRVEGHGGYYEQIIMDITQEELNALFKNLLNVDRVNKRINDKEIKEYYGN